MARKISRFRIPILLLILIAGLAALLAIDFAQAGAQEHIYYVATDGSDQSGDGSITSPWGTITHSIDQVPDGSTILVKPGTYTGRVRLRGSFAQGVTIRSEVHYQARLRNDSTVVTCFYGQGITLEGFDIAHSGSGAGALVIQIQDLIGEPGGNDRVGRITLRNNILHDSYNNDILKINNGAERVLVEGNIFYNQTGSDEHIDINSVTDVVVQDNVFFNDFAGSGRVNGNNTSSYIVIKDSNADDDTIIGSERITVRRNIFLNWEGSTGANFVLIGEDGKPYHEAENVLVENNLLLGNSSNVMRAPFGVKGGKSVIFRNNTVLGDLPSLAYAMRLNSEGSNPPNEDIQFFNNIWSDPTGTMGAENPSRPNDFSDTPSGQTISFQLLNNLYWNGGSSIPFDSGELINYTDDAAGLIINPQLPEPTNITLPRWNPDIHQFADGSSTVRQVFERLVKVYGVPRGDSPILDAADPGYSPSDDILGNPRPVGMTQDIGAVEYEMLNSETFIDVPLDHWAYDYIEILYQQGYVAGCSADPMMYCPENTMTRAESAVFVERGVHGTGYFPPNPMEPIFADVPLGEWFSKWATGLWNDGYTSGCGTDPLTYCPLQEHTRTEGTVFFLRMLNGPDYVPSDPTGIFVDVSIDYWGAKWIEAAYNAGLIPACEISPDLRFCPDDPLDRAMAAYMMVQAKGLSFP